MYGLPPLYYYIGLQQHKRVKYLSVLRETGNYVFSTVFSDAWTLTVKYDCPIIVCNDVFSDAWTLSVK